MSIPLGTLRSDLAIRLVQEVPGSPVVLRDLAASSEVEIASGLRTKHVALAFPVLEIAALTGNDMFDVRLVLMRDGFEYEVETARVRTGPRTPGIYWRGPLFPVLPDDLVRIFILSYYKPVLPVVTFRLFQVT